MLAAFISAGGSGCWGALEINEIGIVKATGIDIEPDGSLRITVLSVQPEGMVTAPVTKSMTWIGTATGETLSDAAANLRSIAFKKLSWLHNRIIIVGEDKARSDMGDVVDFLLRSREFRLRDCILIAEGRAFDMLSVPADLQMDYSVELEGLIENSDYWSKVYEPCAKEIFVNFAEKGIEGIAGRVSYYYSSRKTFSSSREEYEKLDKRGERLPIAFMEGSAAFKGFKMAGWLNGAETRGYMWITGKAKRGIIVKAFEGGRASMEIISAKSMISMRIEGNNINARVKTDVKGGLADYTADINLENAKAVSIIEQALSQVIKSEMEAAVKKAKEYEADIFGFGRSIYRDFPEHWAMMEKNWGKIFPLVDVSFDVSVALNRPGMILRSLSR